jgi:hypothetical protein
MHLHALPHHGNYSLVGMLMGVAVVPPAFLLALFALAHAIK